MPKPKEVFDDPARFWSFITSPSDTQFEGQHFDRKEAGRVPPTGGVNVRALIAEVKECLSAFANANVEGGLLVLGIASDGSVKGVNHLTESQCNSVADIDSYLNNQTTEVKLHDCIDEIGDANRILLLFAHYTDRAICETPGRNPEAWVRKGIQNIPLNQASRDRLRYRKQIVDFENTYCCDFDIADVDRDVLTEFRRVFLPDTAREFTDESLLYEAGALTRIERGYGFTKAGLLFFAANPQRVMPSASIRLMRFGVASGKRSQRGTPTFDKPFTGPITKQIRDTRTFFRESGFFKVYQRRKPGGGFAEEPEYPTIAIDEAIVNAVAHRDYSTSIPIECEAYRDAFIVTNPGRMMQRDEDLPDEFSLEDRVLNSTPRNPKILRWLQIMKDPDGRAFVQAISEGTRRMTAEMAALELPAPMYRLSDNQTELILISNAESREASLTPTSPTRSTEFTNLYPLNITRGRQPASKEDFRLRYKEFLTVFRDVLRANDWYIDRFSFSRIIAHRRGATFEIPENVKPVIRFYPAYEFSVREYFGHQYLCVDYTVQVLNVRTLDKLLPLVPRQDFIGMRCVANKKNWFDGRIVSAEEDWARVFLFHSEREELFPSSSVIPYCPIRMIESLLKRENIKFDLHQTIKQYSLASQPAAARARAEKIDTVVEYVAISLFPVVFGDFEVKLTRESVQLVDKGKAFTDIWPISRLSEPLVEFREHHASSDVREGITRYGAYEDKTHVLELIPVCLTAYRSQMESLIERLKVGKYKYRGAERTFSTRFTYQSIITVENIEGVTKEVRRLLGEHPEWVGDKDLKRIFLVQTPEYGYSADDEEAPYYVIKRLLLERGIPCQMIDTPTMVNPDWKDLNLALNITAKCGVTPWVLPDAIPDADFFVGLSYTQSADGRRIMGFANVFNRFGKWEFYSGNTTSFNFEQKTVKFAELTHSTLSRLSLSATPSIIFHYSAKFSRQDRDAILDAARSVRPDGTYTFVWINSQHSVRVFDSRPETDGSLRRGSYIQTSPSQIFLSTTGYNPFRKAMGTPKPLQINASVYRPAGTPSPEPDMKSIAVQVLSLTKLNWASTDAFTGEPITTKYAGDIAYLTAAFLRQGGTFNLHPALERTPWFL